MILDPSVSEIGNDAERLRHVIIWTGREENINNTPFATDTKQKKQSKIDYKKKVSRTLMKDRDNQANSMK